MEMKSNYGLILGGTACGIVIATGLSVGVIRLCIGSEASRPLSLRTLICGTSLNASRVGFKRLTADDMFIESVTAESKEYSIDRGNEAGKLIDGDKRTLAAPANRLLHYALKFTEPHRIRQAIITWGDYGTIAKYVAHWQLEASADGTTWTTIRKGDSPQEKETVINAEFDAAALRLTAESPEDWIGIYELELVGRPL